MGWSAEEKAATVKRVTRRAYQCGWRRAGTDRAEPTVHGLRTPGLQQQVRELQGLPEFGQ